MKKVFNVYPYSDSQRPNLKWVVRGKVDGKWARSFFAVKSHADTHCQVKNTDITNLGVEGMAFPTSLRIMAQLQAARLEPYGKTLEDAVSFYLPTLERAANGKTVREVAAAVLLEKQRHVKPPTLRPYKTRLDQFVKQFGTRNIATLDKDEIQAWLLTYGDFTSRDNTRRVIVNFFTLAVEKGLAAVNTAAQIRVVDIKLTHEDGQTDQEISILTPKQMQTLLTVAHPHIVPYFAIGAFAGVRPEELLKLLWSDIRWNSRQIVIRPTVSKVGVKRTIPIENNLLCWLDPYREHKGPIRGVAWRDRFREARIAAGLVDWPPDVLRHSYASYWMPMHKHNVTTLAAQMGNSVEVIARHYNHVLDDPAVAEKFWAIDPYCPDLP